MRNLAAAMAGPAPNTTIPGAAPSVGRLVLLTWTHVAPGEVVTAVSMNAKARLASLLRRPSARIAARTPSDGSFSIEASGTGSSGGWSLCRVCDGEVSEFTQALASVIYTLPDSFSPANSNAYPFCRLSFSLSRLATVAAVPSRLSSNAYMFCCLQLRPPPAPSSWSQPSSAVCRRSDVAGPRN